LPRYYAFTEEEYAMKLFRMTLAAAVVACLAGTLAAQEKPAGKDQSKGPRLSPVSQVFLRMDRLRTALEGLDLSQEQKDKLAKIREEAAPKARELFGKMRDVLTEEQRTAVAEAGKKAKDAGKKGREMFLSVESSVKLTDEQKGKLKKLADELEAARRENVGKIREVLNQEQRDKLREKMGRPGKRAENK
jgi:Spy/CpxP family protein refolding chaperone